MKILVVQDTDWLRRGPHQQHHIFEQLSLRGHEVRVIDFPLLWQVNDKPRFWARASIRDGARIYPGAKIRVERPGLLQLPLLDKGSIFLTYTAHLRRTIRMWKPDIVVGLGILTDNRARRIAQREGIPYVAFILDALHTLLEMPSLRWLAQAIEKSNFSHADQIIVINEGLREYVIGMGADPGKVSIVSSPVALERYVADDERERMRRALGVGAHDVLLVFMGWLYDFSGVDRVADTLSSSTLLEGNGHVKLLVIGEGDLLPALKTKRIHLQERLILTGQRPFEEMPALLSAADIAILPAASNKVMKHIIPIKVYEYLAAGKPIISTRQPAMEREFRGSDVVHFVDEPEAIPGASIPLMKSASSSEITARARKLVERNGLQQVVTDFERRLADQLRRDGGNTA